MLNICSGSINQTGSIFSLSNDFDFKIGMTTQFAYLGFYIDLELNFSKKHRCGPITLEQKIKPSDKPWHNSSQYSQIDLNEK